MDGNGATPAGRPDVEGTETVDVLATAGFANVARLELDELLDQLIERARDVQATQGRLRGLLRANLEVARAVDLEDVLRHILEAARNLVDARYAALGVVDRERLMRFLHTGMDERSIVAIGHLPEGKGLLGRLIDYPQPLRLADIASHRSSVGFPANHPPMRSFLGVPIRVGERVFGNLYLTDKQGASEFSADDEELVLALAAAAGVAIENAALFAESRRRQQWQAAMAALATALVNRDPREALRQVAHEVAGALRADGTAVCVPADDPDEITVAAAEGMLAHKQGVTVPIEGTLYAASLEQTRPLVIEDAETDPRVAEGIGQRGEPLGPCVAVPMRTDVALTGVLYACRAHAGPAFDAIDLEMLESYARHAALVLQLAQARQDNDDLRLVEDRQQIAVDLQDKVINHLFGLGLELQGLAARIPDAGVRSAVNGKVDEIDTVIRSIRRAVFSLNPQRPA